MGRDPFVVVISGLRASGKSTLAGRLGPILGLSVLDKDDILEETFPVGAEVEPKERSRLSRRADVILQRSVERSPRVVVASFWRREELSVTAGTPTAWLTQFPGLVEVYCSCGPSIAALRFRRRDRHPAHGDRLKDPAEILSQLAELHRSGPLGLGRVIAVNTEEAVDVALLAGAIVEAPG